MCSHNQQLGLDSSFTYSNASGALVDLAREIVTESENGLL